MTTICKWCGAQGAALVMYQGTSWLHDGHDGHVLGYECQRCSAERTDHPYEFARKVVAAA